MRDDGVLPSSGHPLAWESPATPSPRCEPTTKPSDVTSSALPSDPWLQACHRCHLGAVPVWKASWILRFLLGEQGSHGGFSSCPDRQTQIALGGDQVQLWPRFQTFCISLCDLRKFKGKGFPNGGECVCVNLSL